MEETSLMDGFTERPVARHRLLMKPGSLYGARPLPSAIIYNEMEVNLNQASSKRNITIRFRVYDYGMGLRYEFPQQESL